MLKNKVAVVTGASRGIGRAVALALAEKNIHIIAIARTIGGLEELDDLIKAKGGTATLVPLDVLDNAKLQELGPSLMARYPQIDYLISSAAYLDKLTSVATSPIDIWNKTITTNVTANITLIQTLYPLLKQSPHSRSLFLTGDKNLSGQAYWGFFMASQMALENIVQSFAAENPDMWIKIHTWV
jgi:NAD(P)-dependent dehydrogenase (short-subunit alcohol dehydrogenase family)